MGFWSALGSSLASDASSSAMSGLFQNVNYWDYAINPLTQAGYSSYWNDAGKNNLYWSTQSAQALGDIQQNFAKSYAINAPSWNREGLEKAGYNPILAVTGSSAGNVNTPSINSGQSVQPMQGSKAPVHSAALAQIELTKKQAENIQADTDLTRKEQEIQEVNLDRLLSDANLKRLENAARMEAMTGVRNSGVDAVIDAAGDLPTYERLVDLYRNQIDSGAYKASLGHAVFEDGMDAFNSASSIKFRHDTIKQKQKGTHR